MHVVAGRNAATARADDDRSPLEEPSYRPDLKDMPGARTRDDPAEPVAVGRDAPSALPCETLGFILLIDGTDWFGRMGESWIMRIDFDLRQNGRKWDFVRQQIT